MEQLKKILPSVNIEPERLEMFNLSAAMGPRWAEICNDFAQRVTELGPTSVARALIEQIKGKE